MPLFINLRFDDESTERVAALQRTLARLDLSHYAEWLGHPPHLTVVRSDTAGVEDFTVPAAHFATKVLGTTCTLAAFGLFGGPSPVIWLAPVPDPALLDAHRLLYGELEQVDTHPNYRPVNWVPHVTVAADLLPTAAADAVSALLPAFSPIRARVRLVEVVSFPPAEVRWATVVENSEAHR